MATSADRWHATRQHLQSPQLSRRFPPTPIGSARSYRLGPSRCRWSAVPAGSAHCTFPAGSSMRSSSGIPPRPSCRPNARTPAYLGIRALPVLRQSDPRDRSRTWPPYPPSGSGSCARSDPRCRCFVSGSARAPAQHYSSGRSWSPVGASLANPSELRGESLSERSPGRRVLARSPMRK